MAGPHPTAHIPVSIHQVHSGTGVEQRGWGREVCSISHSQQELVRIRLKLLCRHP